MASGTTLFDLPSPTAFLDTAGANTGFLTIPVVSSPLGLSAGDDSVLFGYAPAFPSATSAMEWTADEASFPLSESGKFTIKKEPQFNSGMPADDAHGASASPAVLPATLLLGDPDIHSSDEAFSRTASVEPPATKRPCKRKRVSAKPKHSEGSSSASMSPTHMPSTPDSLAPLFTKRELRLLAASPQMLSVAEQRERKRLKNKQAAKVSRDRRKVELEKERSLISAMQHEIDELRARLALYEPVVPRRHAAIIKSDESDEPAEPAPKRRRVA